MESKTGMFAGSLIGDEALSAVAGGHRKCHPGRGWGRGGSKTNTVGNIDVTVNGSGDSVTIDVSQQ